ncbi:isochorismatase family protein [Streptomyces sp. NPDC020800]|uniref:isochorismatase family protein n=1 Tax=Streptomyces sp. NPDC020800 TaxID=3365092 RepID=UPI00378F4866
MAKPRTPRGTSRRLLPSPSTCSAASSPRPRTECRAPRRSFRTAADRAHVPHRGTTGGAHRAPVRGGRRQRRSRTATAAGVGGADRVAGHAGQRAGQRPSSRGLTQSGRRVPPIRPAAAAGAVRPRGLRATLGRFHHTALQELLDELGRDTLVFAGCNLPKCPHASIIQASERDYRVALVRDAISQVTGSAPAHSRASASRSSTPPRSTCSWLRRRPRRADSPPW